MPRKPAWDSLPDEELLRLRIKDLGVRLDGTWVEDCLLRLHDELRQHGLHIRPHAWLSDDWFSPDNSPGIAVPFFLAHPRLMRLERRQILEVEGGSPSECLRILRHETGHVVQHAYRLSRRRRWQQLFGRSSTRYPRYYRPNPSSRSFVQHLRLWYAQSHPDEDFAETFAVWLSPRSNWRKRYQGWPALKKLNYVDELMQEIADEKPVLTSRLVVDPVSQIDRTLADYYRRKQAIYLVTPPQTYDRELRKLFSDKIEDADAPAASTFLRHNRAKIRQIVARWTGEHQLTLDSLLNDMIARCRELKLRAAGNEDQLRMDFSVLFTAKTVLSLYGTGRRKWFAL